MISDSIKRLLVKHFGPMHRSLEVGDFGEGSGATYFYSLKNEADIISFTELLKAQSAAGTFQKFPELTQTFKEKKSDLPQCVVCTERGGHWYLSFHRLTGVNYRRTIGKRVVTTLLPDKYPAVELNDKDENDFYGFWAKQYSRHEAPYRNADGLSYWMNKALWQNAAFRSFAVDLFFAEADRTRCFILKDVARTIGKLGFFLLPVSFKDLITYRTPAELIARFKDDEIDLNVDFNKVDLNLGYVMAVAARNIEKRDWKFLSGLDVEDLARLTALPQFYEGFTTAEFVKAYCIRNLYDGDDIKTYLNDYVEMCEGLGRKFRIGFLSEAALIEAHDELVIEYSDKSQDTGSRLPLVVPDSRFDELERKIAEVGNGEFERIKTTARLRSEGKIQHNCVFSRRALIRSDDAAVFHWQHGGRNYTIQFMTDETGRYAVEEVRARFNAVITEKDLAHLKDILSAFCIVDVIPSTGLRPRHHDFDDLHLPLFGDDFFP